jgi:hypothetical protein
VLVAEEIGDTDGARAPPVGTDATELTAFGIAVALGTPAVPLAIDDTLVPVALKLVGAREIWLFARS